MSERQLFQPGSVLDRDVELLRERQERPVRWVAEHFTISDLGVVAQIADLRKLYHIGQQHFILNTIISVYKHCTPFLMHNIVV